MSDFFKEEDIAKFKQVFSLYCKEDEDDTVTAKQCKDIMMSLGLKTTEAELQDMIMIYQLDSNGNRTIEFSEFLSIMER